MNLVYEQIANDDCGSINYKNDDYIFVNRMPYYNFDYKGHNMKEYYEAVAVKLGDIIDEDGFVPAYEFHWDIKYDNIQDEKLKQLYLQNKKDIKENGKITNKYNIVSDNGFSTADIPVKLLNIDWANPDYFEQSNYYKIYSPQKPKPKLA